VTSYEHTLVPISFGKLLIDKITILARIAEAEKLANIRNELNLLTTARARFPVSAEIEYLQAQLTRINEVLWDIEDRTTASATKIIVLLLMAATILAHG
jgi:hypothetical protein